MLSDFLNTKLPIDKLKAALEVIEEFRCLEDSNEYPFTEHYWIQLEELRNYLIKLIEKEKESDIEMYYHPDINPIDFSKGFYVWGQKTIKLSKESFKMDKNFKILEKIDINKCLLYPFRPYYKNGYVFGDNFFADAGIAKRKMLPSAEFSFEEKGEINTTLEGILGTCSVRCHVNSVSYPLIKLINRMMLSYGEQSSFYKPLIFEVFDLERIGWFLGRMTLDELFRINLKIFRGEGEEMLFLTTTCNYGSGCSVKENVLFCISSIRNRFIGGKKMKISDFMESKSMEELDQLLDTPVIQSLIKRAKERRII